MLYTAETPGRTVTRNGRSCLFFAGFSYLGLHQLPAFKQLMISGIERYGTLFPASRISNIRLTLYEEIEHTLCTLLNERAAAVLSSGYLAAQAAVHYAATCGQLIYAPHTHPSLWQKEPTQPCTNREDWVSHTIERVNKHPDNAFVIISDAVNPITSTIYHFNWLQALKRQVLVVLDDSHGIGVLGPSGEGSTYFLPRLAQVRYLVTASLAKAYSLEGGVIAGPIADIQALKQMPFFTASTPMMPANAYTWLQAGELIQKMHRLMYQNIDYLQHLTAGTAVRNPHHLPVFLLPQYPAMPSLLNFMSDRDVIISSFAYPQPHHTPVNRAVISALHLKEDMATLYRFLKDFGI